MMSYRKHLVVFVISLSSLFFACSSNDLCDCVEAADQVNKLSASFFDRPYSELGKDSLEQAIEKRDRYCEEFENMSAKDLHAAKQSCDSDWMEIKE